MIDPEQTMSVLNNMIVALHECGKPQGSTLKPGCNVGLIDLGYSSKNKSDV